MKTGNFSNLFRTADGRSFGRTFLLMCALFLLSGLCNSMLDTLNSISRTRSPLTRCSPR